MLWDFKDSQVNNSYVWSCITSLIGEFTSAYIWEKFEEIYTQLVTVILVLFYILFIIVSCYYKSLYIYGLIFLRFILA